MPQDDDYNVSSQPLRGVVLCCTAIQPVQRSQLAAVASEMGATSKLDLTSDVTHLIVGDIDTPKYKYVAKERPDVKVLKGEWVEAVRTSWLEGGDTDVEALEREYRLPTFAGLRICLTGFEDQEHRDNIAAMVKRHGAEHSGDLTKQVTHLIAAAPRSKKYVFAKQWKIKVVSIEWLDDCIERGMVLDESLYDPLMPQQERGKGAWVRRIVTPTSLGKRARQAGEAAEASDAGRRKLRRTASTKLTSQSEGIWADIAAGKLDERADTEAQWENSDARERDTETQKNKIKVEQVTPRKLAVTSLKRGSIGDSFESHQSEISKDENQGIFKGAGIYLHGFTEKQTSILSSHLSSNGAQVYDLGYDVLNSRLNNSGRFLVLPHTTVKAQRPKVLDEGYGLVAVTEWWVERCLHRKMLIDPGEDVFCRPLNKFPIKGFDDTTISSTNFDGVDLLHLSKAVKLLGATYDDHLKPHCSVLVCNSTELRKDKLKYAFDQDIPAVSIKWLVDCVEFGDRLPFDDYLVQQPSNRASGSSCAPSASAAAEASEGSRQKRLSMSLSHKREAIQRSSRQCLELEKSEDALHVTVFDGSRSTKSKGPREPQIQQADSDAGALRELQPEVNSPKRPSQSPVPSVANADDDNADSASLTSKVLPPPEESENNLHEQIRALRANMTTGRPTTAPESNRDRRRKGLLGRAPSGLSNRSITGSFSRASSGDVLGTGDVADASSAPGRINEPVQSQTLTWEDEEVSRQKEEVLRKMGGTFLDEPAGVKVASIGLVRDSSAVDGGIGSRVRRRPPR